MELDFHVELRTGWRDSKIEHGIAIENFFVLVAEFVVNLLRCWRIQRHELGAGGGNFQMFGVDEMLRRNFQRHLEDRLAGVLLRRGHDHERAFRLRQHSGDPQYQSSKNRFHNRLEHTQCNCHAPACKPAENFFKGLGTSRRGAAGDAPAMREVAALAWAGHIHTTDVVRTEKAAAASRLFRQTQLRAVRGQHSMTLDEFFFRQPKVMGQFGNISVRQQDMTAPATTGATTLTGERGHGFRLAPRRAP